MLETLLANLIHDLRQPLGNIESSAYYLARLSTDVRVQDQVKMIERQVEQAVQMLTAAAAAIRRQAQCEIFESTNSAN
jgi:signal transduction histidine kinase